MTRWAIFSDVHGNLPALEAVLKHLDGGLAVDGLAFLGDAVGYGADPEACLEVIEERCSILVVGNHDHGVIGRTNLWEFNDEAREALLWCRNRLLPRHRLFLETLPLLQVREGFLCVHATPQVPEAWNYIFTYEDAEEALSAMETDLGFVGHSHVPLVLHQGPGGEIEVMRQEELRIEPGHRYLINPGSVGQPRDGDNRASLIIYDEEEGSVHLNRVPYDVHEAALRIIHAGLPASLAHRLYFGA